MEAEDASVAAVITDVKRILWGDQINEELFLRWSQGKHNWDFVQR